MDYFPTHDLWLGSSEFEGMEGPQRRELEIQLYDPYPTSSGTARATNCHDTVAPLDSMIKIMSKRFVVPLKWAAQHITNKERLVV